MTARFYHLGLIGHPLDHSLSPAIHTAALGAMGLEGEYRLYPVPPLPEGSEVLENLLTQMRHGDIHGLNVTIPHKENVIPLVDGLTQTAAAVGAVNTLFMESGRLIGDNTDAPGFLTDLRRFLEGQAWQPGDAQNALVLGAGGAARAVACALLQDGWRVWVASRRPAQAQSLAEDLKRSTGIAPPASISPLSLATPSIQRLVPALKLIVNATPVGMSPHPDDSPWPAGTPFPAQAAVYDLVYNPRRTLLVRQAQAAGLPATTGLGMLIEQAALSFERWTGPRVPRTALLETVAARLSTNGNPEKGQPGAS